MSRMFGSRTYFPSSASNRGIIISLVHLIIVDNANPSRNGMDFFSRNHLYKQSAFVFNLDMGVQNVFVQHQGLLDSLLLILQESIKLQLTFVTVAQMELYHIISSFSEQAGFLLPLIAPTQSLPFIVSISIMN